MASTRQNWISLSKTDTGFVFTWTHSLSFFDRWGFIEDVVRQEFNCYADDDIDCLEDDDGREFVTINGEPIVEVHNCYLTGYVAGSELTRRVA